MPLFLGLDIGTQGAKALVYDDERGAVVGRGAHPFELLPIERPGAAEQEPGMWIEGAEHALRQALSCEGVDPLAVCGVGVSGQQHGFVALDADDRVLRPAKLWCDTETAAEARELSQELGRSIPAGFTASKILWFKRHEPDRYARLRRVLLPHDYMNLHLTGRAVMEAGDASGTGFFDAAERRFDQRAMQSIDPDLGACLPPLVGPDEAIGVVREPVAEALGLARGVQVAPGSGDNMLSALGAGAVEPGTLVISLGTSGTLFGHARDPILDPEGVIAPFCDATGGGLPLLCTMNCTTVTEEVRAAFDMSLEQLTDLASREPAGCAGMSFLPYLCGERVPDWPQASGVIHGLRAGSLRPGLLFRAAMEGASLALLCGHARFRELGLEAAEIRLVGGGSRNPLWRQIIADAFGVPIRLPQEQESAALGAALQAAAVYARTPVGEYVRARGIPLEAQGVEPDQCAGRAYSEAFERFQRLGVTLFAG